MCSQVSIVTGSASKGLSTMNAFERLLTSVGSSVSSKLIVSLEGFPTNLTLAWFFTCVPTNVSKVACSITIIFITISALKRSFTSVSTNVPFEDTSMTEKLSTFRTFMNTWVLAFLFR